MKKTIRVVTAFVTIIFAAACTSDSNEAYDCDTVIANTAAALENYNAADEDNFTSTCEAYRAALETQIEICGDEDGLLQSAIDALGDCETNTSVGTQALMTATIEGVQYNDLRPNGFNIFGKAITMQTNYVNGYDYIQLQGNNTYAQVIPEIGSREINLFIPETAWEEGTYELSPWMTFDDNGAEMLPHYDIICFYPNDILAYNGDTSGTLTVTNFDLENRIIEGTFELQFIKENIEGNWTDGPFYCENGTFIYSLDDEYFD